MLPKALEKKNQLMYLLKNDDDDDGRFLACEDCGKVRV
jgi:hypothetical protein